MSLKWDDLKENNSVKDTWYQDYGVGKVVKKLKTVVYIDFSFGTLKYDKAHAVNFFSIT